MVISDFLSSNIIQCLYFFDIIHFRCQSFLGSQEKMLLRLTDLYSIPRLQPYFWQTPRFMRSILPSKETPKHQRKLQQHQQQHLDYFSLAKLKKNPFCFPFISNLLLRSSFVLLKRQRERMRLNNSTSGCLLRAGGKGGGRV